MKVFASLMKDTIWRIPVEGLDVDKCRADPIYLIEKCVPVKCKWEQSKPTTSALDGRQCIDVYKIASCEEIFRTDRIFMTAEAKISGDWNNSHRVDSVKCAKSMVTGEFMYEATVVE